MFELLEQYHSAKGNCKVLNNYDDCSDGPSFSAWVRMQRPVLIKAAGGNPKYVERKRLLDTLLGEKSIESFVRRRLWQCYSHREKEAPRFHRI